MELDWLVSFTCYGDQAEVWPLSPEMGRNPTIRAFEQALCMGLTSRDRDF